MLDFLNETLVERSYIAANRFTIADIALSNNLKYVHDELGDRPHVTRYFTEHTSRPAYRRIVAQPEYKGSR